MAAPPIEMSPEADLAGEAAFSAALDFAAEVRRSPSLERLPILHETLDAFCDAALDGRSIACKAGCGNCCSQWVPGVKAFEIERIAQHVEAQQDREETIGALRVRLAAYRAIEAEDRDLAYAQLGRPCVFLSAEQTCTIRTIRPETCRTFFSFGPAERCAGHPDSAGFTLSPHPAYEAVLERAASAFEAPQYSGALIGDLLLRLDPG